MDLSSSGGKDPDVGLNSGVTVRTDIQLVGGNKETVRAVGALVKVKVSAHGGHYLNEGVFDVTVTTMDFEHDTRAHIFVSWLHPYKEQKLVVIGDKNMVVFDDVATENKLIKYENCVGWQNQVLVL